MKGKIKEKIKKKKGYILLGVIITIVLTLISACLILSRSPIPEITTSVLPPVQDTIFVSPLIETQVYTTFNGYIPNVQRYPLLTGITPTPVEK
jgi:hypothetical protein